MSNSPTSSSDDKPSADSTRLSTYPTSPPLSDDAVSQTSTATYEHEPFEKFTIRVRHLIHTKWPSVADEDITVERLKGGGFNRIIGFTIKDRKQSNKADYILRIPRVKAAQILNDLSPLQFVSTHTRLPVAEVVEFDTTTQHALENPYMVQHRIPGDTLLSLYTEMSYQSRCQMARQVGNIFQCLTSLRSQRIGRLVASSHNWDGPPRFMVQTLDGTGPVESSPYKNTPPYQQTSEAMSQIFSYRGKVLMDNPKMSLRADFMKKFGVMTSEISAMGYLKDVPIVLCHLDLEPRNILVDLQNESNPVSGVLDWDSAILAPAFMACTPPSWIWAWKDDEDEDEDEDEATANDTPSTLENRELKNVFEEAAGEVYARLAYGPVYRLARRLGQFALFGIRSNEDYDEAEAMLADWSALKEEDSNNS